MEVLLIRHDSDGSMHWQVYCKEAGEYQLPRDIMAHLNTEGVTRLELIPK